MTGEERGGNYRDCGAERVPDQGSHLFTSQFTRYFGLGLPKPQPQCCLLELPPHSPAGRRQAARRHPGSLLAEPARGGGGW